MGSDPVAKGMHTDSFCYAGTVAQLLQPTKGISITFTCDTDQQGFFVFTGVKERTAVEQVVRQVFQVLFAQWYVTGSVTLALSDQ